MNAAQWEVFIERAAVMEYEGGLDQKAATLRAFELCFPADYRECIQITANAPDGETALYEYLEGLIKTSPYLHEKGATMNTETKNDNLHTRQGTAALEYMMAHGIPVIGAYRSGRMIGKQTPDNFITDTAGLADLMRGISRQGEQRQSWK
jgi:hypothetical protein